MKEHGNYKYFVYIHKIHGSYNYAIGARTDVRENSGKLPIDMLKATASDASRGTSMMLL